MKLSAETEQKLKDRAESLAAIRSEYERKQKEVRALSI